MTPPNGPTPPALGPDTLPIVSVSNYISESRIGAGTEVAGAAVLATDRQEVVKALENAGFAIARINGSNRHDFGRVP